DAQYDDPEYGDHVGWGHSAIGHTLAFARLARVRHLVCFHHDPGHNDQRLDIIYARPEIREQPFALTVARDGAELDVDPVPEGVCPASRLPASLHLALRGPATPVGGVPNVAAMKLTRGFTGRRHDQRDPRLPPGQYDVGRDWPVLTAEVTPKIDTSTWTFSIEGLVESPTKWTWAEIHALPSSTYDGDIHCVTTWSKLGMSWAGVSVDTLLAAAHPQPSAAYVLAFCHTGYTTNLPLTDVTGGKAWVAWGGEGEPRRGAAGGAGQRSWAPPLLVRRAGV